MRPSTPVAFALAALPAVAAAQPRPARPYVGQTLSLNPLALPFGFASGEYERALGRGGFAFGVGGLSSLGDGAGSPFNRGESYRTLQAKFKYYPREDGLRGFAVGVTAGLAHARTMNSAFTSYDENGHITYFDATYDTRTAPTVGATLDYNFLIGRRRRFLIGLGVGAKRAIGTYHGRDPLGQVLVDPRVQIGFGF